MAELNLDLLRRRIEQQEAASQTPASPPPLAPAGTPPDMGGMNDRLAKLETGFEWMKVTLALIGTVLIGGMAFLGAQITRVDGRLSTVSDRVDGRISALSEKVDALPDRINANLRDLTGTLAQAILAAKAAPPQVVILPAPQPAPPAPP